MNSRSVGSPEHPEAHTVVVIVDLLVLLAPITAFYHHTFAQENCFCSTTDNLSRTSDAPALHMKELVQFKQKRGLAIAGQQDGVQAGTRAVALEGNPEPLPTPPVAVTESDVSGITYVDSTGLPVPSTPPPSPGAQDGGVIDPRAQTTTEASSVGDGGTLMVVSDDSDSIPDEILSSAYVPEYDNPEDYELRLDEYGSADDYVSGGSGEDGVDAEDLFGEYRSEGVFPGLCIVSCRVFSFIASVTAA